MTAVLERPDTWGNAPPPDRSRRQRLDALGKANEVRARRAQLKRDVKAGRVRVADVLADPPAFVLAMKVWDLLLAVPKVGRVKAGGMLRRCAVSASKTIGGLSERQRDELRRRL